MPLQFSAFLSANRLRNLKAFGLLPLAYDTSWIADNDDAAVLIPTGTIDGTNAVFTVPGTVGMAFQVYKNGVMQLPNVMYTFSGQTITFLDPYVPQPGDYLQTVVG